MYVCTPKGAQGGVLVWPLTFEIKTFFRHALAAWYLSGSTAVASSFTSYRFFSSFLLFISLFLSSLCPTSQNTFQDSALNLFAFTFRASSFFRAHHVAGPQRYGKIWKSAGTQRAHLQSETAAGGGGWGGHTWQPL